MTPKDLYALLQTREPFSLDDLQVLREGLLGASSAFGNPANTAWLESRLGVETISSLIELNKSIQDLNASSTALVSTTNKLTTNILRLSWVLVIVGVVAALAAVLQFYK
jgi:hypothetical protein